MYQKQQYFKVVIERDQDGVFIASVPALHGCRTQAKTYEKVMARIREAIELYLEVLKEKRQLKIVLAEKQPSFFAVEDLALFI
ncbi:MAG: type II toxin-antitoxin system HicB family antitoxin [Candidatus Kuenenbacteria bacterium]